jgi:hypothetical protein
MIRSEVVLEFLPICALWLFVGIHVSIPRVCSETYQLMKSKENLLSVIALNDLQLFLHSFYPIVCIHRLD